MSLAMVAAEEAVLVERMPRDGDMTISRRYFGRTSPHGTAQNQAFLPTAQNRTIGAHFHDVDQFQIMFGAPGAMYQRTELRPLTVHYADAFVTYGPIIGAEQPLRFFTLRAEHAGVTGYMPGARDQLRWRGHRHHMLGLDAWCDELVPDVGEVRIDDGFGPEADGLGASVITAGSTAMITLPDTVGTSGQYVVVADGSVLFDGKECGPRSLGWQNADEPCVQLLAGDEGARLIVCRFPSPSTVIQHENSEELVATSVN